MAPDGYEPWGPVIRDKTVPSIGTTHAGGAWDVGVVFMLSPAGGKWTETVLHTSHFRSAAMTAMSQRGAHLGSVRQPFMGRPPPVMPATEIVFQLTQSGGVWTETILHEFIGKGDFSKGDGGELQGGITPRQEWRPLRHDRWGRENTILERCGRLRHREQPASSEPDADAVEGRFPSA